MAKYQRVFLVVLDSVGIGEMPDAAEFGDTGAHTLGHIGQAMKGLNLPNLAQLGLGNISPIPGVSPTTNPIGSFGKCAERAKGKDTTTGHWEMAGIEVKKSFPTYYNGFPQYFIDSFIREAKIPGILGNFAASGTEIIQTLGDEHLKTGKPIVYTSADSVFQIACHEEKFGLDRLYEICLIARKLCDELGVARVIARPFLGTHAGNFARTKNRKDYSVALPAITAMDLLQEMGLETVSVGKVASIYSEKGFQHKIKAGDNRAIFEAVIAQTKVAKPGLVFANLVDFDMLYGHRRDPAGYAKELEWFDSVLPALKNSLSDTDLLLLSADHGNDPTFPGSDHTREYIPILAWSKAIAENGGKNLGLRSSFADIGATILETLGCKKELPIGTSFAKDLS